MRREPLLAPFLALVAGIVAGHFNYFRIEELLWPGISCGILLIASLLLPKVQRMRVPCLLVCCGVAGIYAQVLHRTNSRPKLTVPDGETALLDGCITDPPVRSNDKAQFRLQLSPRAAARVSVMPKGSALPELPYGTRVEIAAKIRGPHNFANPGEFDYEGWLANQHIYWIATAAPTGIRLLPGRCGRRGLGFVFAVRDWALSRLDHLYPDDPESSMLLKAILLGQTAGVERRWTNDFRLTGTYHALVISGQHVAVLALTLLFLLQLLRLGRIPSLSVAALVSWMYAFVTGLSAPVVRAAGGFTLFLVASFLFRRIRIINGLAAVGLVYLLFDPEEAFDPSFQLSFLSAAALALFALPLMERWTQPLRIASGSVEHVVSSYKQDPRVATLRVELRLIGETLSLWLRLPLPVAVRVSGLMARSVVFVAEAMLVSGCVQFGLALPMICYFHRVSFTGLSANIIVVPLLSCVIPMGFGAILTGWRALAWATALLLHVAESIARWHSHFEPSWRISDAPVWMDFLFGASLILLALALRGGHRLTRIAFVLSLGCFAVLCWQPWHPRLRGGWLEVSAIDVSQGDSIFLAFPNGRTMLVDAGGFPGLGRIVQKPNLDMGEDVVSPYLWSRSIHRLDYVALTHGHSDHMQGLCAILENFHPRELWIGPEPGTDAWKAVQRCAATSGTQIRKLSSASSSTTFGSARLSVVAPPPDYVPGEAAANNDSLVLLIEMGKRRVLLAGDAEKQVENDILVRCGIKPVTLLKVGHHGSKTSTSEAFLASLRPTFAFISAGYLNQFHHPHPEVLERLSENHVMTFRTDQQGLATFLTDGDRVDVRSYR